MRRQAVVLLDPNHPYAGTFSAVCDRLWGLDTVCLYTDCSAWDRARSTRHFQRPEAVVAHYALDAHPLERVAVDLGRRHDVVAVIPHDELHVEAAVTLAASLGIVWADPSDLRRFRDKFALKEHLRSVPGGPRMNASTRVRGLADVRAAVVSGAYERFVLKPNDGVGNGHIGFFSTQSSDDELLAYLAGVPGATVLMEEFVDGEEYCVNGQADADGTVTTLSVYRTHHAAANGRTNLAARFELVRHDSPIFGLLADYAAQVLTAAGLRRSPFHMEVIIDRSGPCLVEVGARLAGVGMAPDISVAHGGSVDAFELAAQHYLGLPGVREQTPDWDAYDARALRTVCGLSHERARITSVHGASEVEAMPEFVHWVFQPRVGQLVRPTVDLPSSPWQVTIAGRSPEHLDEVESRIRATIGWNRAGRGPSSAVRQVNTAVRRTSTRLTLLPEIVRTRPGALRTTEGSG